jgi:hypothetical protein
VAIRIGAGDGRGVEPVSLDDPGGGVFAQGSLSAVQQGLPAIGPVLRTALLALAGGCAAGALACGCASASRWT